MTSQPRRSPSRRLDPPAVVEEEWRLYGPALVVLDEPNKAKPLVLTGNGISGLPAARTRLASCAPALARMLIDFEWGYGSEPYKGRCLACGGAEPPFGSAAGGHHAGCPVDGLLARAGLR